MRHFKVPKSVQVLGVGLVLFTLFAIEVGVAGAQQPTPAPAQAAGPQVGPGGPGGPFMQQFVNTLAANLGVPPSTVQDALQQTFQQMQQSGGGQGAPFFGSGQGQAPFSPGQGQSAPFFGPGQGQGSPAPTQGQGQPSFGQGQGFQHGRAGQGSGHNRGRYGRGRDYTQGRYGRGGPSGSGQMFGLGAPAPMGMLLQQTADILGMTPQDLRTALQGGETLAQVAEDQGVSPDDLANQLTDQIEQAFQDQRQQIHDRIEQGLNQPFPGPRQHPDPSPAPDDSVSQ